MLSIMSGRVLKRAYQYRCYPTPEQAEQLNRTFGCVRYVYNRALAERSRAWTQDKCRMLEYKADWYGRELIAIDRWYPSFKTCSACGALVDRLPLNIREWTCRACGAVHDRDINAAKNILAVGQAVTAWGDGVRPPRS